MDLQVFILCGGLGTRMGAASERVPKPMVEVGGRPLIWHIMAGFAAWGCRRFVLCLGHKGDVIRAWFQRSQRLGEAPDWSVTLAETGPRATTGGRLLAVRDRLEGGPALMTYGDGVADVDLPALLAHHRAGGRLATVTAMRPRSRFGVLDIQGGAVRRFREKPLLRQRVSGGFFVLEPAAFDYLVADEPLEEGALGRLARSDQLSAYPHDGFWLSVDTPRDLAALNALWEQGRRPWLSPRAAP